MKVTQLYFNVDVLHGVPSLICEEMRSRQMIFRRLRIGRGVARRAVDRFGSAETEKRDSKCPQDFLLLAVGSKRTMRCVDQDCDGNLESQNR